jgi:2'-5' RNA ligase
MKNRLRTFLAVSLSPSILAGIEKLIRTLQSNLEEVHWVETKNLHVTLKFLGDIPLNDLPKLIDAVTQSLRQTHSFDLAFQGFGVFPSRESPKTIWIGCQEGSKELGLLAENINEGLIPLGFPKEARRFSPHLTVGRVKKTVQSSLLMSLLDEQQNRFFGSCNVNEVLIVSSELTRRGPIYDELATIPLQ